MKWARLGPVAPQSGPNPRFGRFPNYSPNASAFAVQNYTSWSGAIIAT